MHKHDVIDVKVIKSQGPYRTLRIIGHKCAEAKISAFKMLGNRAFGSIPMPHYWENIYQIAPESPTFMIILEVKKGSPKFLEIESAFKKTLKNATVIKVQRIQNRRLWTIFQTEIELLREKHHE